LGYNYSQLDYVNSKWFLNDYSIPSLRKIEIVEGHIRGIKQSELSFEYPISCIVGPNCAGKSTILAISACSFRNLTPSFRLDKPQKNKYSITDFFIQTSDEKPFEGIKIQYSIMNEDQDMKKGIIKQTWSNSPGRKCKNTIRKKRNVIFLGTSRIIPPAESKIHVNNKKNFNKTPVQNDETTIIRRIAGRILGKIYKEYYSYHHRNCSMPGVNSSKIEYSGFNMGSGEIAIFSILHSIYRAGPGSLIVIDEIELGLHSQAQIRLIDALKTICNDLHCQIICSTHSPVIIDAVPPKGRFYIDSSGSDTIIIPEISSQYVNGMLLGESSKELKIFVEDEFVKAILQNTLSLETRKRIEIFPIGSDDAIAMHIVSQLRERKKGFISFIDGDRKHRKSQILKSIKANLTTVPPYSETELDEILKNRVNYLPGESSPEKELINKAKNDIKACERLSEKWDVKDLSKLDQIFEDALNSGTHNEFYNVAASVHQELAIVRNDLIVVIKEVDPNYFFMEEAIQECLKNI